MITDKVNWRLYYRDGSTFDSTQGEPKDAPAFGVICIPQPDPIVGRMIMHGWDWYYYVPESGQWWGSDLQGVLDRMLHRLPVVALAQGATVSNTDFREIFERADKDKDFPLKSAKHRYESPSQARQPVAKRDHDGTRS